MGFLSALFTKLGRAKGIEVARFQQREATAARQEPAERRVAGQKRKTRKLGQHERTRSHSRAPWRRLLEAQPAYRDWQRARVWQRRLWLRDQRGRAVA